MDLAINFKCCYLEFTTKKICEVIQKCLGYSWGEGSPLLSISKKQKNAISLELENKAPGKFIVALGMCYGNPSMSSALRELEAKGCNKILVLPLYPQYAASSTGSVFDAASKELQVGVMFLILGLLEAITKKSYISRH